MALSQLDITISANKAKEFSIIFLPQGGIRITFAVPIGFVSSGAKTSC